MASTAVVPATTLHTKHAASAAIDNRQELEVPLDYSFFNLTSLGDLQDQEPRPYKGKEIMKKDGKFNSRVLKLNNNSIAEVSDFLTMCESILQQPMSLTWVDLSLNDLTKINPVFCDLPHLKILYLHGNAISELKEVDKLGSITTLTKVSLHGNPIENIKNYRWYVLSRLTQLISFDMSGITKADRATAATLSKMVPTRKKKKSSDQS